MNDDTREVQAESLVEEDGDVVDMTTLSQRRWLEVAPVLSAMVCQPAKLPDLVEEAILRPG